MAKYPEVGTVGFANPMQVQIETKTLFSNFDDAGEEQRKQKWAYPRRNVQLRYNYISKEDAEVLWSFYIARGGAFEAFNFFWPEPATTYPSYIAEYAATGDGTAEVFNLPSRTAAAYTLHSTTALGVASDLTEGVDYNFTATGGEDGADKIDFSDSAMTPPALGDRLTWSFTGTLKIRCRYAEDIYTFNMFFDRLSTSGVIIKGLLNT